VRGGFSSMQSNQFGRGRVPMQQSRVDAGTFKQASVMTGANPVSPSHESFRPSDRPVNASALPSHANSNQRFFSTNGNAHQNASVQGERGAANFNRGGNSASVPSGQNAARQNGGERGYHSFGENNSANANSVSRPSGNGARNPVQQNSGKPVPQAPSQGFHSFGEGNSGNVNRGSASQPTSKWPQTSNQGQRGSTQSPSQPSRSIESSRPGWRPFTPPSSQQTQSNSGRTFEGQGSAPSRPNYSQPPQPQRQYQNNARGNPNNNAYNRPTLDMRQPVVTPRSSGSNPAPSGRGNYGGYSGGNSGGGYRAPSYSAPPMRSAPPSYGGGGSHGPSGGGSYSAPAMRSAPSGGGYGGGGYHGAPSGGGHSGGESRGGSSNGNGGGNSSGRNRR